MTISSDRSPWERGPFAAQGEFLELGVIRPMNNFIYCSLASFTLGISMSYGEKLSLYPFPLRAMKIMENIYLSFLARGEEVGTLSKELLSLSPAFQVRMTGPPFPKAEPTTLPWSESFARFTMIIYMVMQLFLDPAECSNSYMACEW